MYAYLSQRLLAGLATLVLVFFIVSAILRLIPGDAAVVIAGEESTDPKAIAEIREKLGLDRSYPEQVARWLGRSVRGDFGESFMTGEDVQSRIGDALPVTLELAIIAAAISLIIGFPIGIMSALQRGRALDFIGRIFAVLGLSVPGFWMATLLLVFPAMWWGWTPPLRYEPLWEDAGLNLQLFLCAGFVLGWAFSAAIARMVRSTTLEVLGRDFVRTARSKGLRERRVLLRHALPNSLLPVISVVGTEIAVLFGGTVVIERIFNLPGLGRLTYDAILTRDYPQVQANVLLFAAALVLVNLITDISYGLIDPRVRLG
jgi:peptide/nickel transport system permease protein